MRAEESEDSGVRDGVNVNTALQPDSYVRHRSLYDSKVARALEERRMFYSVRSTP